MVGTARWLVFAALMLLSFASAAKAAEPPSPSPLASWEIVDLTQKLDAQIPIYPGGARFELTLLIPIEKGYYANRISMGEHAGTHLDAPSHFVAGAKNVDQIPMDRLFGPLVMIDVRKQVQENSDFAINVKLLRAHEQQHGLIPVNAFVVANTGWASRWHDPQKYVNLGADGQSHFPGFDESAALYLANERKSLGMGIDTLSTDVGTSKDFAQHRCFPRAGGVNLENLTNLDKLPLTGAYLFAAPLRVAKGSAAPARVVAFVPRGESN